MDACHGTLDELLQRLGQSYVPFTLYWELTYCCNLDCRMCYRVPRAGAELSTEECCAILEQLAAAGALQLVFTGGEILTRGDFFTIAAYARSLGFALYLKTNGTLITNVVAQRIAALKPLRVDISLLGASEATVDQITRRRHTLPRVLKGIRLLQEAGVRVHLFSLLMRSNFAERDRIMELADELGVVCEQVISISTTGRRDDVLPQYQLSREQIRSFFQDENVSQDRDGMAPRQRTCNVGLTGCLIDPYGDVYPCVELRVLAGNLREHDFSHIWEEAPIFRLLRSQHTREHLHHCRACVLQDLCRGRCAGEAWKEHGDLFGAHTQACTRTQVLYTLLHQQSTAPMTPYLQTQTPL